MKREEELQTLVNAMNCYIYENDESEEDKALFNKINNELNSLIDKNEKEPACSSWKDFD